MQVDMHYYGTYAMARAAGLNGATALRIAEAAQFVDDYTEEEDIETSDGALISYWPSGHGMVCDDNFDPAGLDKADPHRVWVTFHFLPGGNGSDYQERMICGKDGAIAQEALELVLARSNEAFAPELAGIMAHIYADTFSHYGFSGLRNDRNLVRAEHIKLHVEDPGILHYIKDKAEKFMARFAGATTRGLGHSCVADFPDRPYLRWEFTYENGAPSLLRNNPETYMNACEKLFGFFSRFKAAAPEYAEVAETRDFEHIRAAVADILAFEGKQKERIEKWRAAADGGVLLFSGDIPEYGEKVFKEELGTIRDQPASEIRDGRVWHFTRGIEVMRGLILNELLPKHGLIG